MNDKGREECKGMIEVFIHRMRSSMGVSMTLSELREKIQTKYDEKIRAEFEGTFGDQSAGTLQTCLKTIDELAKESQRPSQPESQTAQLMSEQANTRKKSRHSKVEGK